MCSGERNDILRKRRFVCSVTQSCLTLCSSKDCSPPGSSVHRIFQARMLEWGAMSYSMGSSRPRGQTHCLSCIGRQILYYSITWEAPLHLAMSLHICLGTSQVAQTVKHLPTMWETRVQSLGWEDLLEKEMAAHSSVLAWKMEEPGRLQSTGRKE